MAALPRISEASSTYICCAWMGGEDVAIEDVEGIDAQ